MFMKGCIFLFFWILINLNCAKSQPIQKEIGLQKADSVIPLRQLVRDFDDTQKRHGDSCLLIRNNYYSESQKKSYKLFVLC